MVNQYSHLDSPNKSWKDRAIGKIQSGALFAQQSNTNARERSLKPQTAERPNRYFNHVSHAYMDAADKQQNYMSINDLARTEEFGDEANYTYKSHRKQIHMVRPRSKIQTSLGSRPTLTKDQGSMRSTAFGSNIAKSKETLVQSSGYGKPSSTTLQKERDLNLFVENENLVSRQNHLQYSQKSLNQKDTTQLYVKGKAGKQTENKKERHNSQDSLKRIYENFQGSS